MSVAQSVAGLVCVSVGVFGCISNLAVLFAIASNKVFYRSAYVLMANIAVADCLVLLVSGCYCGVTLLLPTSEGDHLVGGGAVLNGTTMRGNSSEISSTSPWEHGACLLLVGAWFSMISSYAFLGINRCVAICYYRTGLRRLNRISSAVVMNVAAWTLALLAASVAALPTPAVVFDRRWWFLRYRHLEDSRPLGMMLANIGLTAVSLLVQWLCSALVLLKVRDVHNRISQQKLTTNSASRFRKQMRLTFQFILPSVVCCLASVLFFSLPLLSLNRWQFLLGQLCWMVNHWSNPCIYLYFNDTLRATTRLWRRRWAALLCCRGGKRRQSLVRASLQVQSRDFEQLCEFMLQMGQGESISEGWCSTSEDDDDDPPPPPAFKMRDTPKEEANSNSIQTITEPTVIVESPIAAQYDDDEVEL